MGRKMHFFFNLHFTFKIPVLYFLATQRLLFSYIAKKAWIIYLWMSESISLHTRKSTWKKDLFLTIRYLKRAHLVTKNDKRAICYVKPHDFSAPKRNCLHVDRDIILTLFFLRFTCLATFLWLFFQSILSSRSLHIYVQIISSLTPEVTFRG